MIEKGEKMSKKQLRVGESLTTKKGRIIIRYGGEDGHRVYEVWAGKNKVFGDAEDFDDCQQNNHSFYSDSMADARSYDKELVNDCKCNGSL